MSVNKCIFIGNLGKDPETRQINENFKVSSFSLACSEKWTDKNGEQKEATEWINCRASNKLADICEKYLKKGMQVYIEGKFKTQSWDKEGVKQYTTFIEVQSLQMLGSKPNQASENLPTYESPVKNSGLPPSEMAYSNPKSEPEDDSLPF